MQTPGERHAIREALPAAVFLAVSGGAVLLCLAEAFSVRGYRGFPSPVTAFRCLMAAELFFVLFLWPGWLFGQGEASRGWAGPALCAIVSLPVLVAAVAAADVPIGTVARGYALLMCAAMAVAGVAHGRVAPRWYYLCATGLCGGLPLAWFVARDVLAADLAWIAALCPFWAMDNAAEIGGAWPLPAMIGLAAVAAALWWLKPAAE